MDPVLLARVRAKVIEAAAKFGLDVADDVMEIPVRVSSHHTATLCGHYQCVASNGLGRITVFKRSLSPPEHLEAVLLHEYAHALVHFIRGAQNNEDPHGKLFQSVMLTMGQEPSKYVLGASDGRGPETVYQKKNA